MYKIYIDSKIMNKRYDISELATDISISFHRIGTASKLEFSLVKDDIISYGEGDCVLFYDDNIPVFKGYVFTKVSNEKKVIKTTCYDQLRYLKAKDSFQFKGESLKEIIERIANRFKLSVGSIEDIGYTTPYYNHEDESLLDIITYHIQQAIVLKGTLINFYDDFGKLTVKSASKMVSKYVIGYESLAQGYSYKTDIDSDTYNLIKLVRPNEATKKAEVFQKQDSDKIKRWGTLQYYEVMDENLNDAQILDYLKQLFEYHNKVFRSLSIDAIGIPGLRGGHTVYIDIPNIGDISVNKYLIVDSVTHKYKNNNHTMSLELTVR